MQLRLQIPLVPDDWVRWTARIGLATGLLALVGRCRIADLDMFHQMALFREALATGWIPLKDVFAYTPTVEPVVHHEWGTGAVLYLVTVGMGLGGVGLMALKYLLTAATAAGCVVCARLRGADERVFIWLAVPVIGLAWVGFTTIRAQVFTLLLLTVLLLLLEEDRRGRRWWLAVWLPVYVIWLNLHAGFVVGFGIFGLYSLERLVREAAGGIGVWKSLGRVGHLVAAGLAMVALTTVNPYGFDYIPYLFHALSIQRPLILEWMPMWDQPQASVWLALYGISLAVVIYAAVCRGVRQLPGLAIVLVTAYLGVRHFRHVSLYGVVWICYVPAYLEGTELGDVLKGLWTRRKTFLFGLWSIVAVAALGSATWNRVWELWLPTAQAEVDGPAPVYPAGAVEYLARHNFKGNLMVPFGIGAFVSWELYPDVKVSIDSRYEAAYPHGALDESVDFYCVQPGWEETLDKYPTDAVLVPHGSRLDELMETVGRDTKSGQPAAWRRVYQDDGYSLFMRSKLAGRFPTVDRTGQRIVAPFP